MTAGALGGPQRARGPTGIYVIAVVRLVADMTASDPRCVAGSLGTTEVPGDSSADGSAAMLQFDSGARIAVNWKDLEVITF